jgi:ubiquinone/menaquinone biosynthesis C-methylase UbiE
MNEDGQYYLYDPVKLEVNDFHSEGLILDIGGGGEGVIGRLKGKDVVAIDLRKDELEEAVGGPLKIVMDARDLKFLDNSFNTATAFFSLMYIKTQEDQQKIFEEVWRVLRPGGYFHVWEIDLEERMETNKEAFVVFLRYCVGNEEFGTGYGQPWPTEPRGEKYYVELAVNAGFKHIHTEREEHTINIVFLKV